MNDTEATRGDWATHYNSFDGHGVVPASNPSMRLLQDAVKMRWPWQPRPEIVSKFRAQPRAKMRAIYETSLATLYPSYAEAAIVAVLGEPKTRSAAATHKAAFTALMMAKEGTYMGEATSTPRITRYGGEGPWYTGRKIFHDYASGPGLEVGEALMRVTSLGFPPAEQRLWMRRYIFDEARKGNLASSERGRRSGAIGIHLAVFADTMLVAEAILEGGPRAGFKVLHEHLLGTRTRWSGGLDRLQVPGRLYWDTVQDFGALRMLTHWSIDQPLRLRQAPFEVRHRFAAHNIIELVRLTFKRRKLPDLQAAAQALTGEP